MENGVSSTGGGVFLSRMALNDNKAGMEGLDRDKINKIIMESSKGSRFYENELKRELQVNQRIEKMMLQKAQITEKQLRKAQALVERTAAELERTRDLSRVIVHVDMDAFYAAVEMRDCPELKDKPMAVGSMSMLSTSNYHARKYAVRAAMPGFIAKKLCPDLIIVPPNFDKYRAVSSEIREIFADYDPHFQPVSLDEAYLDFTDHLEQRKTWPDSLRTHRFHANNITKDEEQIEHPQESASVANDFSPVLFDDTPSTSPNLPGSDDSAQSATGVSEVFGTSVEEAVREMRFRIEQKTTLTASAGIAPNMMLAKVCSDRNKPNGQYRLLPTRDAVMEFIQDLPVRKISGIGKVSEKMLKALDISNCSHLSQQTALLSLLFSAKAWHYFMQVSLGLGSTCIDRHEERKSMSTERTFRELKKLEDQLSLCRELCEELAKDMKKEDLKGKTITLKLKNVNFEVKTRATSLPYAVATEEEIFAIAKDLLKAEVENESPQPLRLRLMGVRISAFVSADDKTPLQKSIIGFLQPGRPDSSGISQVVHRKFNEEPVPSCPSTVQKCQTQEEVLWQAKKRGLQQGQTGGDCLQSFFQRAHAKRLQLQAVCSSTQDEGQERKATAIISTEAPNHNNVEASLMENQFRCSPTASDADNASLVLAQASTSSGFGGPVSNSLTCPVCFLHVTTADLNLFNRHIDQCLSDISRESNQSAASDSDKEGCEGMDECQAEIELQMQQEKVKSAEMSVPSRINPPQDQHVANYTSQTILLINGDSRTGDLHQPQLYNSANPILICPVCQVTQNTNDLTVFNSHVDLCLNQEVLHELDRPTSFPVKASTAVVTHNNKVKDKSHPLSKQPNQVKTKRRGSPPSLPSKKAKGPGLHSTIDKFFR